MCTFPPLLWLVRRRVSQMLSEMETELTSKLDVREVKSRSVDGWGEAPWKLLSIASSKNSHDIGKLTLRANHVDYSLDRGEISLHTPNRRQQSTWTVKRFGEVHFTSTPEMKREISARASVRACKKLLKSRKIYSSIFRLLVSMHLSLSLACTSHTNSISTTAMHFRRSSFAYT